jgi:hypothetical protein
VADLEKALKGSPDRADGKPAQIRYEVVEGHPVTSDHTVKFGVKVDASGSDDAPKEKDVKVKGYRIKKQDIDGDGKFEIEVKEGLEGGDKP